MYNSKKQKTPIPHNGKKVNDWETLRPYVETSTSPKDESVGRNAEKGKIDPMWGFGYQAELSGNNSTTNPNNR